MGGADQWGNITAGTELIRRADGLDENGESRAFAVACPLLLTSTGAKFGKTEQGTVWLSAERTSPYEFYQYWIGQDDRDVAMMLRRLTLLGADEIYELEEQQRSAPEKRPAQRRLASEMTARVHGEDEARRQEKVAEALFAGQPLRDPEVLDVLFARARSLRVRRRGAGPRRGRACRGERPVHVEIGGAPDDPAGRILDQRPAHHRRRRRAAGADRRALPGPARGQEADCDRPPPLMGGLTTEDLRLEAPSHGPIEAFWCEPDIGTVFGAVIYPALVRPAGRRRQQDAVCSRGRATRLLGQCGEHAAAADLPLDHSNPEVLWTTRQPLKRSSPGSACAWTSWPPVEPIRSCLVGHDFGAMHGALADGARPADRWPAC